MVITVISDCRDSNAQMRACVRAAALIPGAHHVQFCGVSSEIEAAGNVVDALDALAGHSGILLVNVAPRNGDAKRHGNGVPFGACVVDGSWILGTLSGAVLSLVQKVLGRLIPELRRFKMEMVVHQLGLGAQEARRIADAQFRSFEILPRLAAVTVRDGRMPEWEPHRANIPVPPHCVWMVDCFGNLKLTILPWETRFRPGRILQYRIGSQTCMFRCYPSLASIPDGVIGVTVGSSGLGRVRFLEIQMQGGSAAVALGLKSGDMVSLTCTAKSKAKTLGVVA